MNRQGGHGLRTPRSAIIGIVWLLLLGGGLTVFGVEPASALTSYSSVSAGNGHTCAVASTGKVSCWGYNVDGELGNGSNVNSSAPEVVQGGAATLAVAAGTTHSCVVLANRTVECWGANGSGQLGDGTTTGRSSPVAVAGLTSARSVGASTAYSCAVIGAGVTKCWGLNASGQLGDGSSTSSSTPVTVHGITSARMVATGRGHACVLEAAGTVKCWGENSAGELGNGSSAGSSTPVAVQGISTAVAVAAGRLVSCAVLASGAVRCWGDNSGGALGDGTRVNSGTPVAVSDIRTATSVSVADNGSPCALLADGTVRCWGFNGFGGLGDGTTTSSAVPVKVRGISTARSVDAGDLHACASLADGSVKCWGDNRVGQLGDRTMTNSPEPVIVYSSGGGSDDSFQQADRVSLLPEPVLGASLNLKRVDGAVTVRLPGTRTAIPIEKAAHVPVGSVIDTTQGRVRLYAAQEPSAGGARSTAARKKTPIQKGEFFGGRFLLGQLARRLAIVTATLYGGHFMGCSKAVGNPSRRHLWGSVKGHWRIIGRGSYATVKGTVWLVDDRCHTTRTVVRRGLVEVRDFRRARSVFVKAGQQYSAALR